MNNKHNTLTHIAKTPQNGV